MSTEQTTMTKSELSDSKTSVCVVDDNVENKKQHIYKKMEELLLELDGDAGLPMEDSGFVTDDGFDLGSTTEGYLDNPVRYVISYSLSGECLNDDDFPHLNEMSIWDEWQKLYKELKEVDNKK
jgi:hypothetical protein